MKRLAVASLILALSCLGALAQTVAQTTNGSVVITAGSTFQTVFAAIIKQKGRPEAVSIIDATK